jgi:hypothetical protein
MDFIRAIIGIFVIIFLAVVVGKTQNSKHPAVHFYTFLSALTVLLLIRWFL